MKSCTWQEQATEIVARMYIYSILILDLSYYIYPCFRLSLFFISLSMLSHSFDFVILLHAGLLSLSILTFHPHYETQYTCTNFDLLWFLL